MVDEIVAAPTPETAPAAAAHASTEVPNSAAPAVEPASAAPVVTTTPAQEPVKPAESAPVSTPTPGAEEKPAAEAKPSTILGAEPPKEEAKPAADGTKPADAKPAEVKPGEPKKDEASQSAEPAPLPIYEPWTLPDGIKLDDTQAGEFNKLLGEFQASTKAETAAVQKFGQELVSRHVAEVKESIERTHKTYQAAWLKQAEDWKQAFISDPEIGGNRQETTVAAANEFIVTHGGTPAHQTEFRALMQQTGLGNHPAMIRILANAKNSPEFTEGKPLAGAPVVAKQSKSQKFYGKKTA